MNRKPPKVEGSILSEGHGGEKFKTAESQSIETVVKESIDPDTPEKVDTDLNAFVKEQMISFAEPRQIRFLPTSKDLRAITETSILGNPGDYTVQSENLLVNFNFVTIKGYTLPFTKSVGHQLADVAKIMERDDCRMLGLEVLQWFLKDRDKMYKTLRSGHTYILAGSYLRDKLGHWCVPTMRWEHGNADTYNLILNYVRLTYMDLGGNNQNGSVLFINKEEYVP